MVWRSSLPGSANPKTRPRSQSASRYSSAGLRSVARLRNRIFFSLADLNQAIRHFLGELNRGPMEHHGYSRRELFEMLDQPALRPLPELSYEFATWKKACVNIDHHIAFEKRYYTVPHTLIYEEVFVRATQATIEIFFKNRRAASHPCVNAPGRHSTLSADMPPAHQKYLERSPKHIVHLAETIGPQTAQVMQTLLDSHNYPQQAYRSRLGLLRLAKLYGEELLEAVCGVPLPWRWYRALPAGIPSYEGVNNILDAKLDQVEPEEPSTMIPAAHDNIRGQWHYL